MHTPSQLPPIAWVEEFGYAPVVACGCEECVGAYNPDIGSTAAEVVDSIFAVGR